ncbi:unnamed protein product, partial [Didymodactylos carnosus]
SLFSISLKQMFSRERRNCRSPSTLIEKKREAYGHSNAGRPLKVMKLERTGRKPYLNDENE